MRKKQNPTGSPTPEKTSAITEPAEILTLHPVSALAKQPKAGKANPIDELEI